MELDGIMLYYSLSYTLWGPLLRSSLWAHPRHVTGVKSCEPGAYYLSLFFIVWEPSSPSPSWAVPHLSTGAQHSPYNLPAAILPPLFPIVHVARALVLHWADAVLTIPPPVPRNVPMLDGPILLLAPRVPRGSPSSSTCLYHATSFFWVSPRSQTTLMSTGLVYVLSIVVLSLTMGVQLSWKQDTEDKTRKDAKEKMKGLQSTNRRKRQHM